MEMEMEMGLGWVTVDTTEKVRDISENPTPMVERTIGVLTL